MIMQVITTDQNLRKRNSEPLHFLLNLVNGLITHLCRLIDVPLQSRCQPQQLIIASGAFDRQASQIASESLVSSAVFS